MQIAVLNDAQTGASAKIATHLGFNCFEFKAQSGGQVINVIDANAGFAEGGVSPSHGGIPLLFPFPNRIRGGKYNWEGKEYELPESLVNHDGSGNAIHGFCLDRPWRIVSQTESSVTGIFRISEDAPERLACWPTDGEIEICYSLVNNCLRAEISIRNPTEVPFPWGFGTHGYFSLPLTAESNAEKCTVYAPVKRKWDLENCLPKGNLIAPPADAQLKDAPYFGGLKLDDVYTDVRPEGGAVECRVTDEEAGMQVVQRCSEAFREIVAFTPPWTSAVCLEPYTCTTDAINLQQQGVDAGLQVLSPGKTWNGWIDIAVGPVVC